MDYSILGNYFFIGLCVYSVGLTIALAFIVGHDVAARRYARRIPSRRF